MIDPFTVAFVVAGAVLLFLGATLSVYGVVLLGAVLGGGGAYLAAPNVGGLVGLEGVAADVAAVALGIAVGGVVGYVLLSAAVAMFSFVVGTFLGFTIFAPLYVDGPVYLEVGFALAVGAALAVAGTFLTKTTLIVVTSVVGAALASRSLTFEHFVAAQEAVTIDPLLFDAHSPVFLGLAVLGILVQLGLVKFGYVRWIGKILPGVGGRTNPPEKSA